MPRGGCLPWAVPNLWALLWAYPSRVSGCWGGLPSFFSSHGLGFGLSTPDLARARHGGVNILLGEATGLHNGLLNTWMASSRAADEGSCQVTTCAPGQKGDSIHSVLRTCAVAGYQQAQPTGGTFHWQACGASIANGSLHWPAADGRMPLLTTDCRGQSCLQWKSLLVGMPISRPFRLQSHSSWHLQGAKSERGGTEPLSSSVFTCLYSALVPLERAAIWVVPTGKITRPRRPDIPKSCEVRCEGWPFFDGRPVFNMDELGVHPFIMVITSSTAQGGGGSFKNRKPIGEIGCCEPGMAERIHWWTERCLRSPLFLSLSLTVYPPTNLSSMYLSIYRSISLSFI